MHLLEFGRWHAEKVLLSPLYQHCLWHGGPRNEGSKFFDLACFCKPYDHYHVVVFQDRHLVVLLLDDYAVLRYLPASLFRVTSQQEHLLLRAAMRTSVPRNARLGSAPISDRASCRTSSHLRLIVRGIECVPSPQIKLI